MQLWNDAVLGLGYRTIYLDVAVEQPTTNTTDTNTVVQRVTPPSNDNNDSAAAADLSTRSARGF